MENTTKLNTLIALIQAFLGACKDLHYTCKGYSRHIFADAIADDDLYDTIDSIKENISGRFPVSIYSRASSNAS